MFQEEQDFVSEVYSIQAALINNTFMQYINDNNRLVRKDEQGEITGSYTRQFLTDQLADIQAGESDNKEAELAEVQLLIDKCGELGVF